MVWVGHWLGTAQQVGNRQVLDRDHVVRPDELPSQFVVEVPALVRDLAVPGRDRLPSHRTVH